MTKYMAEVFVEIELDNDDQDGVLEAFKEVDQIMGRAWDTDRGRHHVKKWQYTMVPEGVDVVPDDETAAR